MKKETTKKSKLWLWILLAVLGLAIIGGAVAAFVLPGLLQQQGPTGPVAEAKLYWNLDRNLWLEAETNMSAREKAEDGYYHIRYAFDGKIEELKITDDKRLVNYLDSQDVICLAFDENGIVVDCAPASTYFTPAAKDLYTKRVQGTMLQLNSSMAMNGMDMEFDISSIPVYEVAEGSENKGEMTTPKWLDVVTIYNDLEGKTYAAYVTGHLAIDAEVGWRVENSMYAASTGYKRVPDKDGVYTIPFAMNGEIVNRYIKDYDMAISIESQSMYTAYFALEYDEDGYIIDWENPAMAIQGVQLCAAFNVDTVQDGYVTATRYLSGNNQGESVEFTYDESCEIYQCCIGGCFEKHCGERISELKVGDMISVFTDLDGKAVLIYVSIRAVDTPAYYNLVQYYSWTDNKSTRVPNEDGYYVFDMAVNGGVKTVRTKNKEIVELIDANHNRVMGLELSGSIIKKYLGVQCVSGRAIAFGGRFVTSYTQPIISVAATSDITAVSNYIMRDDCKIYTVDENYGVKLGSKTSIKVGDKVLGLMDARGELNYIYVQQTYKAGYKIGWNMARKYSTVIGGTTRTTDEEGYYVYDVAYNGDVYQYKTKNKAIADFIDLQNAPVFGFKEKNGIITDVCTAASAVPYGMKQYNYNNVDNLNGGILTSWYMSGGVKTMGTQQWKVTSKTKVFNVSKGYEDHPGEKTKVKVGDKIQALVNTATGVCEYIFIMNRPVDSPIYWMVSRVAPKTLNGAVIGSNRIPDEDGYYVIDLLHDGKVKQYKTKDEMVAAEVDTYTQGLGLKLKEGTNIIERVVSIADTMYPNTAVGNQDVKSIKGSTITTERCRLTSSNYGEKLTLTIGKKVKIYNVSSYAENWGAPAKLSIGDRIVAYSDLEGNLAYIFITKAAAREKGSWGYCEHCGKTVFWDSYSEVFAADGHYYLPTDMTYTSAITFGSTADEVMYDQVFDLNGHTLRSTTSAFKVVDKLTIVDSVGTGMVTNGKGVSIGGVKQGGNIYVDGGVFTLLSGTISNGAVGLTGVGSNISALNGTVNIKGGTISGGVGYLGTAVYHNGTKGGINISGGKLNGSVYAEETKMITLSGTPTIGKLIVAPGTVVKLGALKKGANITVKGDGIFTTESNDINTIKGYFKVANSKDTITVAGKALKYNNISGELVVPEPESPNKPLVLDKNGVGECVLCGEKVQWTALHEGDIIGDMNPLHEGFNADLFGGDQHQFHYYLAEDMTSGDGDFLYSWQGNTICLHLNGKTLNARGGFYGGNGASINIYGEGKVHYLANSTTTSYTAGNMFELYTANVSLYGGEFTSATNMIRGAGAATVLSISDDAIIKGNVKMDYGNVSISGNVEVKRISLGETAKLTVSKLFKGKATLSVAAPLEEGNLIPEANAAVLGKYSGKLTYADFREIVYQNGRLKVVGTAPSPNDKLKLDANNVGLCNVCFEEVQWIPLYAGQRIGDVHSNGQALHYYVAEDMTAAEGDFQFLRAKSEDAPAQAPVTICLHLNGKILNVKGVIESGFSCTTNIMGNGTVLNNGTKELFQMYSANLNLYGGAYYAGDHLAFRTLTEAAKVTVMEDAKLYGNAELSMGNLTLKGKGRVDNILLTNAIMQKDTNGDGTAEDVTVYGKVTVAADWAGQAMMTVDPGNMDGKLIKAECGVAQGDFTGTLINEAGKKFVNSDGRLQLTNKSGSIPEAPTAPPAPAIATPPLPEGINDDLVLDSENKAKCGHCGEVVVWTPVYNGQPIGTVEGSGSKLHYYLAEDHTSNGRFFANKAGTGLDSVCLHLNGHNLNTELGFALQNASKFALMGNGNVKSTSANLLLEIYTCTVNIYGGNLIAGTAMYTQTDASIVSVYGDVQFNGLVRLAKGRTYFAHNASANTVDVSGTAKFQLANNWNGTLEISVADDLMEGNLVKKSAVELIGAVDGTITHATGVVTIVNGQLCITEPEPETPVWGVFNPEACDGKAYCPACGEAAGVFDWVKVTSAPGYIDNTDGSKSYTHYYLSKDYDYISTAQFIGLNRIGACLHLNGHKLTTPSRLFITAADANTAMTIIAGDNGGIDYSGTTTTHQGGIVNSTASLKIIGGTYTSTQTEGEIKPILNSAGPATLTDAIFNGIADVKSTVTVIGKTSFTNLTLSGNGKLVITEGWSGNIVLNISSDDIIGGKIKATRAVVNGDFTGTITLADGRTAVKDGNQLKVIGDGPSINDNLVLDADNKAKCLHCNEVVEWIPIYGNEKPGDIAANNNKLHFYLAEDNNTTGYFIKNVGGTGSDSICLHLNGHNLNCGGFVLQTNSKFALMGNGIVTRQTEGWILEIWTSAVKIYGGTFNKSVDNQISVIKGGNSNVTITGDAVINAPVEMSNGVLTVGGNASFASLNMIGGKLTIAEGWDGTMGLTVADADISNNIISASRVVVEGDITGTVTMADGRTAVKEGNQLKIVGNVTTGEPVWGTFEPWNCGGKAYCEACGEAAGPQTWTAIQGSSRVGAYGDGQHYHVYLAGNVDVDKTMSQTLSVYGGSSLCLHLNGKEIINHGRFFATGEGKLSVMGSGNVIFAADTTFTGTDAEAYKQAIVANGVGGVYLYGGTYSITGDAVTKGLPTIKATGKVFIKNATVNGVALADAATGQIKLEEGAVVQSVQIGATSKLTVAANWTGTATVSFAKALVDGVVPAANGVAEGNFTGTLKLSTGETLVNDNGTLKIANSATQGELVLDGNNMGFCEACNATVQWTQFTQRVANIHSGHNHYYLAGDLTLNDQKWQPFGVQTEGSICFHFNGYTLTSNSRIFQTGTGSINLITKNGCWVCTGVVPADYASEENGIGKGLTAAGAGGINVYGGTYTFQPGEGVATLPMLYVSGGPIVLKDATINGCGEIVSAANSNLVLKGSTTIRDNVQWLGVNGKITIDTSWTGSATITLPQGAVENGVVKANNGVANGDFTGTLTLSTGEKLVNDNGSLKVAVAAPTAPTWGTFDPWNFDGKAYCEHCGEAAGVQTWTELKDGNRIGAFSDGQHYHYYLSEDVDVSKTVWSQTLSLSGTDTAVCLHLNGKSLTNHGRMLVTGTTNTLAIMGDGNVIFAADGNWPEYVGTFMLRNCKAVYLYGGNYSVTGTAQTSGMATISVIGNLYIKDATVNGYISAENGATVTLEKTAQVEDIRIVGNGTTTTGKLVVAAGWTGTAKLTLPEGLVVNNLVAEANGAAQGDFTGTLTLASGGKLVNDNGRLKAEITDPVWGVFEPWKYGGRAYCEACGQAAGPKTWVAYNGEYYDDSHVLSDAGVVTHYHFYLDSDKGYDTKYFLNTYENICFNLNGKNLTATDTNCSTPIYSTQRLCIMGDGTITGCANSAVDSGSVFAVNGGNASGSLKIYGGTFKKPANSTNPLISIGANGGKIYIYGGTFDVNGSSPAAERGNLFYIQGKGANKALVEIYGGTFIGDSRIGSKDTAADYDGAATLKVLGGNINGVVSVTNVCEATLGGAAVVKEISVDAESKLIVKSDFTGKASASFAAALVNNVVPAANGAVVAAAENTAVKPFTGFLSLTDGRALVADGTSLKVPANALLLKDLEFTPGTQLAVCPLCGGEAVQWTDVATKSDKRIGWQNNAGHLHLYLSEDMVATETLQFAEFQDTNACFHLNGHNLTTSSRFVVSTGTVNILGRGNVVFEGDCVTTSETNKVTYNSTGFAAGANGILNVYGGNYATAGAALADGKPMMSCLYVNSAINLFDVSVSGTISANGPVTVDASAMVDLINLTANGKLNVLGSFTGSVVAKFNAELTDNAVPEKNGSSTGAFTGSVTLPDGTVLIGSDGKLIKLPENT